MTAKLALQLYSLRAELEPDYRGILEQVAAAGYQGVEPAGYPGSSLQEAADMYRELGFTVCSAHTRIPVGDDEQRVIEEIQALGATRIVSGRGPDEYTDEDKIQATCDLFNQAAANAAKHGLTFGIHNHWWEFEPLNGEPVYRHMLRHLDPAVFFEIDTYWVQTGGCDPAAVVRELGPRIPLLHIKDGPCRKGEPMVAVGEGVMDFDAVTQAAAATEWYIVELDACATDMMEAVVKSAQFLKENGHVEPA